MEKYAWKGRIKDGKVAEYEKRHRELWADMQAALTAAGIVNYTVWTDGTLLFGYYECEKGVDYAVDFQVKSPVVQEWEAYMSDIIVFERAEGEQAQPKLKQVFSFR